MKQMAAKRETKVRSVAASEARQNLSRLLKDVYVEREPIVIEKGGIPVAALVSLADLEVVKRDEQRRREAAELLDRMRAPFRGVPTEEIERKAVETVRAVRREMARERKRSAR